MKKIFRPTVGKRFVFYQSLEKLNSSDEEIYNGLYDEALSYFESVEGEFSPNSVKDDLEDSKINQLRKFLRQTIEFERKNEKSFIRNKITNNPILKEIPQIKKKIEKAFQEEEIDYPTIINILNISLKNSKEYKINLRYEKERLTDLNKKIQQIKNELSISERKAMEETYFKHHTYSGTKYQKQIGEKLSPTFNGFRAEQIEKKLNQLINSYGTDWFLKDKNLHQICVSNFSNHSSSTALTIEEKRHFLTNLILAYLKSIEPDFQNIEKELQKTLNNLSFSQDFLEFDPTRKGKNVPIFLREESGQGLADELLRIVKKDKKDNYEQALLNSVTKTDSILGKEIEEALELLSLLEKGEIPKGRKEVFGKRYRITKKKRKDTISTSKAITLIKTRISQEARKILQENNLYSELSKLFIPDTEIKINTPAFAELITAIEDKISFNETTINLTGPINLKNDLEFSIRFAAERIEEYFQEKKDELVNLFSSKLIELEEQVRKEQYKNKKSITDPSLSRKIYLQELIEMEQEYKTFLEQQNLKNEVVEEELENLFKNSFYVQKSVKDFKVFDNDIGFVGGSLGSNWMTALDNLYNMYAEGGISVIDKEYLENSIINCSSASIGSFLKNPIQTYLSFAAAMMMFNYGAVELAQATDKLTTEIKSIPNFINIYVLNGIYVPSSFVLTQILNGLEESLNLIEKQTSYKTGIRITNKTSPSWIKEFSNLSISGRWDKIRSKTQKEIKMDFTFLAGFLDIIESLEQTFPYT